jgi:hypothetical protein
MPKNFRSVRCKVKPIPIRPSSVNIQKNIHLSRLPPRIRRKCLLFLDWRAEKLAPKVGFASRHNHTRRGAQVQRTYGRQGTLGSGPATSLAKMHGTLPK